MTIFRQYIAPILTLIIFLIALVAVTARAFLPGDMAAPAPTEDVQNSAADLSYVLPNNPLN